MREPENKTTERTKTKLSKAFRTASMIREISLGHVTCPQLSKATHMIQVVTLPVL